MKFFAIVCALMIICIYTSETMWHEKSMSHKAIEINCRGRSREIANGMARVLCEPRPTLIPLTPALNYVFHPNHVSVRRCGGYCPNKSCMPIDIKTEMINVTIKQMNKYVFGHTRTHMQCYHVAVEQHTKCKCQCNVKETDCNILQVYDKANCECTCKKRDTCKESMTWNEKSCECMCNKQEEICSTGLVWVPAMCGCAKVEMMPSMSNNYI